MGKGSNTTTTQQQQTYNPAGASYITNALNQGQAASQLGFNLPQAPVAGFSQDQQSAFGNINSAQGMAQPYINQAQQYFSPQGAQQFMNPYAANVMAGMKDVFGQQASQNTGQLTQAAGGVGADRIAVGQSELARQQDLSAGQTLAGLYGQSVQQAQSAGYGTAALGSQAQNAALSGAQAQLASGGLQQQLQQAQMNSPYQQQLAQAAFPYQQAQFLAGITGSLAPGLGGTTSGTGSTTTPPPSMLSQILGIGTAAAGAAGGAGAFGGGSGGKGGGVGSYGQASNATGYGAGTGGLSFPMFARGGEVNAYAGGGATFDERWNALVPDNTRDTPADPYLGSRPSREFMTAPRGETGWQPAEPMDDARIKQVLGYDDGGPVEDQLPPNFNDKPINVAEHSIIPTVQTPAIRPEVPHLNLTPPPPPSGGGSNGLGDAAKMIGPAVQLAGMFLKRGGRINPYAEGGAVDPPGGPDIGGALPEAYADPNIGLGAALRNAVSGLATLPRRAIDASAQDVQRLGEPDYQRQSIGPAVETAMTMTGGAGAIPAEANALRAGLKLPANYYDKVPMDMRMSRKGVSHPGLRWEVYDSKTGEVVRKDVATRSGANLAQDRLDNKYGGYKYQVRPTQAKELTESEAQFLKDKDISFDPEAGMARGGRTRNAYAAGGTPSPLDTAQWPYGPEGGPSALDTANWPSGPVGGPSDVINPDDPVRMPSRGAYENWQKGADTQMALSGNDGSATPVAYKPAFPPPSGSHGRSVGAPVVETPEDAPQDVSDRSRTPAAPQEDTPAGKRDRFIDSPWAALMAAGLGIAGGTSPFAAVNIGQGGMQGLKTLQEQRASGQKDETIDQATRRLDLEAKHHEDQFTRMTPYQQEKLAADKRETALTENKPIKVGVDMMGHDILGIRDKETGAYVDPITRKPVLDPNARAPSYNIPPGGKEDEAALPPHARLTEGVTIPEGVDRSVLARVSPDVANTVRAIDEGRANLSSIPMKDRAAYLKLVNEYDPSWNQNLYSLRKKQNDDLSSNGNAGKMLLATNQLLPHLNSLGDRASKLDNGNYPGGNVITNWFATQRGDPRVKDFQTIRAAAANDAARLLRGTGAMAEKDIEDWRNNFNEAGSPAQLQTSIASLADDLIGARVSSIQHAYRMNMRMEPPEMVSKEAQAATAAIKARAEKANAAWSGNAPAPAAPPPAAAAPAGPPAAAAPQVGERRQFKQGWGVWNGKSWEPAQ